MKKSIVLVVAFFLAAASLTLDAAPRPDMTKHMKFRIPMAEQNLFPARILLRMKDEIGLTDKQIAKIEEMRTARREASIKRKADIELMELKVKTYLKEGKIDRGKLEKLIRQAADLKTGMQITHINHLLDLRELLTKEQLEKIDELKKNRRSMRHKSREDRQKTRRKLRNKQQVSPRW